MKDLRYLAGSAEGIISELTEFRKRLGPEGSSKDAEGNEPESIQEMRRLVDRTLKEWKACGAIAALWEDGDRFPPDEERPLPTVFGKYRSGFTDTSRLASEGLPGPKEWS